MPESNEAAATADRVSASSPRHPIKVALYLVSVQIPFWAFAALGYWHHRSGYPVVSQPRATVVFLCVAVIMCLIHGAGFVFSLAGLAVLRRIPAARRDVALFAAIMALLIHSVFTLFFSQAFGTLVDTLKRPNQAMQLTASKPAVYAWRVCRRKHMLRRMHRGLAAADLVSR